MSKLNEHDFVWLRPVFLCLLAGLALGNGRAQDTSTTTRIPGQSTMETQTRRGEVVYVSGSNLVVKTDDGELKDFVVPNSTRFNVDGKSLSVHQLTPGMKLKQTIVVTTTPYTVRTVRNISGKVWYVNAPKKIILTLPNGTNKEYNVPDGTMFNVDGKQQSIFHVRKGSIITATVITESPETVSSMASNVTGRAPTPAPAPVAAPETPPMVGVLLIETPTPATPAPAQEPAQQEASNRLPKTGSELPLIGLLGMLFVSASLGLSALRRR